MWKRLTAMSGDEVHARVLQAISKRMELAFYRAGVGSRPRLLSAGPSSEAKFFFGENDVHNRAALLRAYLPEEVDAIIRDADEVCRHEFRLLGCDKMKLGEQIDWHLSQGKRDHRLKPWYKINFLDFDSVGDHKLVWELNRHQHLVTLAKAWGLTSKRVYAAEIVAQWYSWQKANPYPLGINWASTLEAAFRSISWLWVRNLLGNCAEPPANFQRDLLLALQLHGRHIERYLSTYFSPNTHLLGEAVALFFIGTSCPQIAASQRWRELGWKIILAESERQVRPDGVYFEQSLYYHVYALDFFLHARLLATENGVAVPARFDDVLKKMLDFIQELSGSGAVEGFGDDDGGRVFNPRRNRVEYMTDPLAIGAAMFGRPYVSTKLTEESIWLFGDKAIKFFEKPRAATSVPSRAFPASGIYLMNDCEPFPQQLMIDAGPQGSGSCGHGHADALSIRLLLQGRRFLIDPGTFCYVSAGEERNQFRGTGAHNTVRIDSVDQAVPEGPFAWSSLPNTTAETWLNGATFDLFVGSHDGYKRLPEPVLHRRFIFHVKGGLWLVRDVADGRGTHLLEGFWHFSPGIEITEARGAFIARVSAAEDRSSQPTSLALLLDHNSAWRADVSEGHVSPAYGAKQFAPVLRFSVNASVPEDCAILLLAGAGQCETGNFSSIGNDAVREVRGYRYQTAEATEFVFFAEGSTPWTCGHWKSDARLLYCKLEGRRLAHVIMVCGTFGECRAQRFISHPLRPQNFEWVNGSTIKNSDSAEAFVVNDVVLADSDILDSVL
ncbi:MAG: alginate lyase family protein [Candidatus Sulfotelmatobacter sp.]